MRRCGILRKGISRAPGAQTRELSGRSMIACVEHRREVSLKVRPAPRPHGAAGRASRGVRRWSRRRFHGTGRRLVISAWGGGAPGGTVLSNGAARRHAPDRGMAIMGPFLDVGSARPGMGVARAPWSQPTSVRAGRVVARRFPEYCEPVFGPLRCFDRPPMVFHRRVAVQRSPSSAAATQGPDSSG